MLLKSADCKDADLAILNNLLNHRNIPDDKKQQISRELYNVSKGIKTEKEATYEINFHFGASKNIMVLHDLRLELNGRVAQIDHLLINRLCDVYVLETKSFSTGLSINELGEFSTTYDGRKVGIASPVEQNARHITVLRDALKQVGMPRTMGISIPAAFHPVVLVSQNAVIQRPRSKKIASDNVIKLDQFFSWFNKQIDKTNVSDILGIFKICSGATVMDLGVRLAALHQPRRIDYIRKFDLAAVLLNKAAAPSVNGNEAKRMSAPIHKAVGGNGYFCNECRTNIAEVVAKFCWNNKIRFSGKVYCRPCQAKF